MLESDMALLRCRSESLHAFPAMSVVYATERNVNGWQSDPDAAQCCRFSDRRLTGRKHL
jgi:hypothetical protein